MINQNTIDHKYGKFCSIEFQHSVKTKTLSIRKRRWYIYLFILGQVGGNSYSNKGGGVNYLCLPNDPENGKTLSRDNDQLFGAEYQTGSYHKPSKMTSDLFNKEVPCAVCYQRKRSTVLMIPGSNRFLYWMLKGVNTAKWTRFTI